MPDKYEHRSYQFEVRSEKRTEGSATLIGTPIVYNSYTDINGWFREVIESGALDGANLKDVPLFVNHNDRMIPIARSRNNNANSTMRLTPSLRGLDMEADIDIERNATAAELNSAVDRGDISGMSFAFTVREERWEDLDSDYPTRHIVKFDRIAEVSAVTHPAYEATNIEAFARSKEALDNARSALDSARAEREEEEPDGLLLAEKEKIRLLY